MPCQACIGVLVDAAVAGVCNELRLPTGLLSGLGFRGFVLL